ncbi:MAG: hypothetical protein ACYSRZ_00845, partial [Planctomycetota bacterium]
MKRETMREYEIFIVENLIYHDPASLPPSPRLRCDKKASPRRGEKGVFGERKSVPRQHAFGLTSILNRRDCAIPPFEFSSSTTL